MFKQPNTKEVLNKLYSVDNEKLKRSDLSAIGFNFEEIANKVIEIIRDLKKIDENQDNIKISKKNEEELISISNSLYTNVIESTINFIVKDNPNSSQ